MVDKGVLFQTFTKLESYNKINIISDILRFSNSLELEFYSSVIESLLNHQKLSFESLKEELNHDDNILFLKNTESVDSKTRSKLISTLSLLKVSNVTGAAHIFEFLRKNYYKFKELAHSNPNTYEEILLIYQLANDHPAFTFSHCQEIYDYLKEIKAVPVIKDFSDFPINDDVIIDLNVASIEKNEQQQYIYRIKVKWNWFECCISRSLEDIYKFYSRIYQMFTLESKMGEICTLYLSYIPDNLEFSKTLMSKFLKDFLNSPSYVLNCDYVRQFFQPRFTDKHICDCDCCRTNFNKWYWSKDQRFDHISNCSSPNNPPSDNEDYSQSIDNKTEMSSRSLFDFSNTSEHHTSNFSINNHLSSDDGSDSSLKPTRNKNRTFNSSGSSPINTPSDESEICTKNGSSKHHHSTERYRHLNKGINTSTVKDLRTENWLCQSSNRSSGDHMKTRLPVHSYVKRKSELETFEKERDTFDERFFGQSHDMSGFYSCQIGNLLDWLKQARLHKYYVYLKHMDFGEFHNLSEDDLNNLGFVDGASKKLISLIRNLKPTDINCVDDHIINLVSRDRSTSNDSSRSIYGSCGDISPLKSDQLCDSSGAKIVPDMSSSSHNVYGLYSPLFYSYMSPHNLIMFSPNAGVIPPGSHVFNNPPAPDKLDSDKSQQINS